jgi:hypothetical protein
VLVALRVKMTLAKFQGIGADSRELRQIPGKRPDLLDCPYKNRAKAGDLGTFLSGLAIPLTELQSSVKYVFANHLN